MYALSYEECMHVGDELCQVYTWVRIAPEQASIAGTITRNTPPSQNAIGSAMKFYPYKEVPVTLIFIGHHRWRTLTREELEEKKNEE